MASSETQPYVPVPVAAAGAEEPCHSASGSLALMDESEVSLLAADQLTAQCAVTGERRAPESERVRVQIDLQAPRTSLLHCLQLVKRKLCEA